MNVATPAKIAEHLVGINPGLAIDKLKKDVHLVLKENQEYMNKITETQDKIVALNKKKAEFQEKTD